MVTEMAKKGHERQPLSSPPELVCRMFSLAEIRYATGNFKDGRVIGSGGFGKVYRGLIKDASGTTILCAIKRLHSMSNQGAPEFWAEVRMLSRLRHCNLVSLIGYCNDGQEMALVYEFMPHGTLKDYLYKGGTVFSWLKRLKICIDAARGLDYLHTGTGTQHGIIHRDVKSSNILLDKNDAAKVADFGLAKTGPLNQTGDSISTLVKGTFGYMDPNYYYTGKLTVKSDVYAFGVVLLEVLCGRHALDPNLDEGLAIWAQEHIRKGRLTQIIDPRLKDQISKKSLEEFARIAVRCLLRHPNQRPTMAEVVVSLEHTLSLEKRRDSSSPSGTTIRKVRTLFFTKRSLETKKQDAVGSEGIHGGHDGKGIPLPAVADLHISGNAVPGEELLASAYTVHGATSCTFQWFRLSPSGSSVYIEGASSPAYTVVTGDLGNYLVVEVVPFDDTGRMGKLVRCIANNNKKIATSRPKLFLDVPSKLLKAPIMCEKEVDNGYRLPAIESLHISGSSFPGGELMANVYFINGANCCTFQWFRHFSDGSYERIEGATKPTYTVLLGDMGTRLAVDIVPMDEKGRRGATWSKCMMLRNIPTRRKDYNDEERVSEVSPRLP